MTKKKCSYSRFYAIAKAKGIDLDRYKETLVLQFTDGRTSSLREMMPTEYEDMCECLQSGKMMGESIADHKERLRKARSAVLNACNASVSIRLILHLPRSTNSAWIYVSQANRSDY